MKSRCEKVRLILHVFLWWVTSSLFLLVTELRDQISNLAASLSRFNVSSAPFLEYPVQITSTSLDFRTSHGMDTVSLWSASKLGVQQFAAAHDFLIPLSFDSDAFAVSTNDSVASPFSTLSQGTLIQYLRDAVSTAIPLCMAQSSSSFRCSSSSSVSAPYCVFDLSHRSDLCLKLIFSSS